MKTLFIVFEGVDGSGTTTQAMLLHNALMRLGRRSVLTSEPTQGPVGNVIRQVMTGRIVFADNPRLVDRFLAYLFATDRFDHLHNDVTGILCSLRNGFDVISTRYLFSSLAYHVSEPDDLQFVTSLNAAFPRPDLTVYLDCPVSLSLERLSRSRQPERYETEGKLHVVRRNFENIFRAYEGEFLRIDASLAREAQHETILAAVCKVLEGKEAGT